MHDVLRFFEAAVTNGRTDPDFKRRLPPLESTVSGSSGGSSLNPDPNSCDDVSNLPIAPSTDGHGTADSSTTNLRLPETGAGDDPAQPATPTNTVSWYSAWMPPSPITEEGNTDPEPITPFESLPEITVNSPQPTLRRFSDSAGGDTPKIGPSPLPDEAAVSGTSTLPAATSPPPPIRDPLSFALDFCIQPATPASDPDPFCAEVDVKVKSRVPYVSAAVIKATPIQRLVQSPDGSLTLQFEVKVDIPMLQSQFGTSCGAGGSDPSSELSKLSPSPSRSAEDQYVETSTSSPALPTAQQGCGPVVDPSKPTSDEEANCPAEHVQSTTSSSPLLVALSNGEEDTAVGIPSGRPKNLEVGATRPFSTAFVSSFGLLTPLSPPPPMASFQSFAVSPPDVAVAFSSSEAPLLPEVTLEPIDDTTPSFADVGDEEAEQATPRPSPKQLPTPSESPPLIAASDLVQDNSTKAQDTLSPAAPPVSGEWRPLNTYSHIPGTTDEIVCVRRRRSVYVYSDEDLSWKFHQPRTASLRSA
ncbi:hypothetical protein FRB99_004874 [Tulasnella sp. 403]|nr:hypothetical protein FRB99_004874 [Tulasnella sp. 403]